ncbi:MAG: phage tail tape measure protein, partial [Bacilli bacterium]|nr:phage tail tape measure protein [Bacilli bacterium]
MADEIGRAFQKVGGSASALQVPFEQVSAWIAVVSSKTRESAESIGTSFKAILARIQNMKEYGFDEEDGTKVNEVAKSLATVGIQLMDTNGQFRNTGVLMDQLGKKWDNLDSRTKAYLATTIAGTRQQSRFYALMDGYSEATELYINALNSAGVATQKFGIYQESTQAKMDKFSSTLNTFWQNAIDSDTIKSIIDLGTIFIELIIKIVDKIGIIIPTFTALGLILTFLSGTFRGLTGSVISTTAGLMGLTFATQAERTAMTGAALATALFSNALKSIPGVALISALTIGAGLLAEWAINAFTAKNKTKELTDEYNKSMQSIKENDFSLNDKFSSLDSGIQNNIIKFFNNLKSINEDLNFDNFMSGIDATKLIAFQDALDKFKDNGNIDELNGSLESLYDHLIDVAKQNGVTGDSAKLFANQFIKMQNPIEYAKYSLTQFTGVLEGLKNQTITTANAINIMEKLLSTTVSEETIKRIALHNDEISKLKDKAGAYALAKAIAQEELDANPSGDDQFGITSKFLGKTPTKSKIGASIAYGIIVNKYQEIFDQFLTNKSILGSSENTTLPHDFSDSSSSSAKDQYQTDQYEQALAALNQQLSILSYNKSKLSQTSSEYRNIISQEISLYKQQQSLAHSEADRLRNKIASGSLDQKEIDETKKTIQSLGDTWLDLQSNIDSLNFESITSQNEELSKTVSTLSDKLQNIKSELQLLTPGTSEYTSKLQSQVQTTKEYIQALEAQQSYLQQQIALDSISIAKKEELTSKLKDVKKELFSTLIDLKSELASLANETIQIYKDAYEAQKDAAVDAIDEQIDAEEKRHKQVVDNLDDELDQYNDLIDAKLDFLDTEDDELQYQKNLTKAQEEAQDIQNQIDVLSLDDSPENKIKLAELNKQLAEKDTDIEELQHDHTLDLRKKNLESLKSTKQKEVDLAKDTEDELYDATKERLDDQKELTEKYWDNIINDEQRWIK